MTKKTAKFMAVITTTICALYALPVRAQNIIENSIVSKFDSLSRIQKKNEMPDTALGPNDAATGMMVPPGWGGSGTSAFGGIAGTFPEQYASNKADLIAVVGFCTGDPARYVNFAASVNITDVHRLQDFSGNFVVSRVISTGNSISAGALQAFTSNKQSDSSSPTFYVAYSHAVQWLPSLMPGSSVLSYTIGIGNGRFLDKSPEDIKYRKGKYATAVFASTSYEVLKHTNVSVEWYAQNLGVSLTTRPLENSPFSIGAGVDNLTRYTGNKTAVIFSIGYPVTLVR